MAVLKLSLLRKSRAVYLTHWIFQLMDSLAALVTMLPKRRLIIPAFSAIILR